MRLSIFFLVGGIAGCASKSEAALKTAPPPVVVVTKVATRDVQVEVRAPVDLKPIMQADVGSKTLGYLDAVLVDRGEKVKRGQVLALVRPSDLPDQLSATRGALAQAEASEALAKQSLERMQRLAPSGVVSQQELQQAQAAVASAEAQTAASKAQVAGIAVKLGETQITSPLDGYVAYRRLDPGALVGPPGGGSIVTVARIDVLRVLITITERDVHLVKVGQDVRLDVDALHGKAVMGRVVHLAPTLDPGTRTLDAIVRVENPNEELRPGMFGRGSIIVDRHPNAPVIPASAVQISSGKRWAYVLKGDKVERRELTIGVDEGTWVEVLKGVVAGDEVVTTGVDAISDEAVVRAVRGIDPFTGKAAAEKP